MGLSVNSLVGLRMWGLAYASETPTLQIGERKASTSPLGRERITGDYALHIQCSWRVAVADTCQDSVADLGGARTLLASMIERQPRIIDVREDAQGTLRIQMESDMVLELISAGCATDEEAWRLFHPGDDLAHLVRYGSAGGTRRE